MDDLVILATKAAVLRNRVKQAGVLDGIKGLFRTPGSVGRQAAVSLEKDHPLLALVKRQQAAGDVADHRNAKLLNRMAARSPYDIPYNADAKGVYQPSMDLSNNLDLAAGQSYAKLHKLTDKAYDKAYYGQLRNQAVAGGGATLGLGGLGYAGANALSSKPPVQEAAAPLPPPELPADKGDIVGKIKKFVSGLGGKQVKQAAFGPTGNRIAHVLGIGGLGLGALGIGSALMSRSPAPPPRQIQAPQPQGKPGQFQFSSPLPGPEAMQPEPPTDNGDIRTKMKNFLSGLGNSTAGKAIKSFHNTYAAR